MTTELGRRREVTLSQGKEGTWEKRLKSQLRSYQDFLLLVT